MEWKTAGTVSETEGRIANLKSGSSFSSPDPRAWSAKPRSFGENENGDSSARAAQRACSSGLELEIFLRSERASRDATFGRWPTNRLTAEYRSHSCLSDPPQIPFAWR